MFRQSDPYTYYTSTPIKDMKGQLLGTFVVEYQASHYDVVAMNGGLVHPGQQDNPNRKYVLSVTQRIKIFNPNGCVLSPVAGEQSYDNYPALLNSVARLHERSGISSELVDYSPQTINSQIQTSGTSGSSQGETQGSTSSNTVGSSVSQSNNYGASIGFSSEGFNLSGHKEHSNTSSSEHSSTTGHENSQTRSQESSSNASMSIKDWGAYCLINPNTNSSPSWLFGQEYPWDAIQCRHSSGQINPRNPNQVELIIPSNMLVRLYDGYSLYPPSHLSMFGINFVTKVRWIVSVDDGTEDTASISHTLNYYVASHFVKQGGKQASVFMDNDPTPLELEKKGLQNHTVDLGLLALEPLGMDAPPGIIGFIPDKFTVKPAPAGANQPVHFKVYSTSNNLRIQDSTVYPAKCTPEAGFSASETSLTATFTGNCQKLSMDVKFKVLDTIHNYTLFLKHWKVNDSGIMISIKINDNPSMCFTKYIDDYEAEGGENNLTSIALRDLNFASVNYHDYLNMGLNTINITISPLDPPTSGSCAYQLRALSIEAS